jgi:DNA polymerase III subunit gamma/tau
MQLCSLNSGAAAPEKKSPIAPPNQLVKGQAEQPQSQTQQTSQPVQQVPRPAATVSATELPPSARPVDQSTAKPAEFPKITIERSVPPAEKPQPSVQSTNAASGALSLKDMLKKNKIEEAAPDQTSAKDLPSSSFTADQLSKAWIEYANSMNERGKVSLYTTLIMRKPELKENYKAYFQLDNKVQEDTIKAEMPELLSYLRNKLNNFSLVIETEINKVEAEKRPYTSQDKYRRMTEINPNIQDFRQQLDLEIE